MNTATTDRSLAILTWRAPVTLARTLNALAPITHLFSERLVVCQESDPEEIRLAEQAGYTAIGTKENLGIQGGLKHAVESTEAKRVLLLENDCHFLGDANAFEGLLDREVIAADLEKKHADLLGSYAKDLKVGQRGVRRHSQ